MRRNIEFKARIHDPRAVRKNACELAKSSPETVHQTDTYFFAKHGRLKLRETSVSTRSELIGYDREDTATEKLSSYRLLPVEQSTVAKELLSDALGIRCIVKKVRQIWLVDSTRIHLDEVENLGDFLEIEVVLTPAQTEAEGHEIASFWRQAFSITDNDLIAASYSELILSK